MALPNHKSYQTTTAHKTQESDIRKSKCREWSLASQSPRFGRIKPRGVNVQAESYSFEPLRQSVRSHVGCWSHTATVFPKKSDPRKCAFARNQQLIGGFLLEVVGELSVRHYPISADDIYLVILSV
jgi:hypothetical protein